MAREEISRLWKVSATTTESTLTRLRKQKLLCYLKITGNKVKWMAQSQYEAEKIENERRKEDMREISKERVRCRQNAKRRGEDPDSVGKDLDVKQLIVKSWPPQKTTGIRSVFDLGKVA
jgi:hypothetical protein